MVEAFACATPAIVRDAGGSRDLIDASGAGFVYNTAQELEALVKRIAGDNDLRTGLGESARAAYCNLYTADHHLQAYLGHIAEIRDNKGLAHTV